MPPSLVLRERKVKFGQYNLFIFIFFPFSIWSKSHSSPQYPTPEFKKVGPLSEMQSKNDQWPILNDQSINSLLFGVQKERTYESLRKSFIIFVAGVGPEPTTSGLWIRRSNQLSYPAITFILFVECGCKGSIKFLNCKIFG